jgi:cell fate regulator YaaT (PSP1 superfamily)
MCRNHIIRMRRKKYTDRFDLVIASIRAVQQAIHLVETHIAFKRLSQILLQVIQRLGM